MKWISVKERLPQGNGMYLVWIGNTFQARNQYSYHQIFHFDKTNSEFQDYCDEWGGYREVKGVSHWMILPNAPEGIGPVTDWMERCGPSMEEKKLKHEKGCWGKPWCKEAIDGCRDHILWDCVTTCPLKNIIQ